MVSAGAPLRVVFFGTPSFAVPSLRRLVESRHAVVGVITQPDRPRGRGQQRSSGPIKALALERAIPVLQPERLARDSFEAVFSALGAELGVVTAYGKILPEWLLQIPRLGMINVHASLLPKYRGAAPVHRAVVNGETETGVTIMRVVKALDAGPMLGERRRAIGIDDSSDVVERDLAILGADLLLHVIEQLASGTAVEVPQPDAEATYAPRLTKEEGRLDFTRPALVVHNRIRGLRPWPGAYTFLQGTRLVIHRARLAAVRTGGVEPGTCIGADGGALTIACGEDEAIDVLSIQPEGRRVMSTAEYLAGHPSPVGQRFG